MLTNCFAACAHLTITVSEIERDICGKKSSLLSYPLAFDAPVKGFPSEYRHPVWYGKTRMVGLPDGEKNEDICNRLGTIRACDRQTDGQTDRHLATAYTRYAYASRSKNHHWSVWYLKGSSKLFQTVGRWRRNSAVPLPSELSWHKEIQQSPNVNAAVLIQWPRGEYRSPIGNAGAKPRWDSHTSNKSNLIQI